MSSEKNLAGTSGSSQKKQSKVLFQSLNIERLQAEFFVKLIEVYWTEIGTNQPLMDDIIRSYYTHIFVQFPYPVNKILCEHLPYMKVDTLEEVVAYIIGGKIHEVTPQEKELAAIEILNMQYYSWFVKTRGGSIDEHTKEIKWSWNTD